MADKGEKGKVLVINLGGGNVMAIVVGGTGEGRVQAIAALAEEMTIEGGVIIRAGGRGRDVGLDGRAKVIPVD